MKSSWGWREPGKKHFARHCFFNEAINQGLGEKYVNLPVISTDITWNSSQTLPGQRERVESQPHRNLRDDRSSEESSLQVGSEFLLCTRTTHLGTRHREMQKNERGKDGREGRKDSLTWSQKNWVQDSQQPLASRVTLGKLLSFSGLQFLQPVKLDYL